MNAKRVRNPPFPITLFTYDGRSDYTGVGAHTYVTIYRVDYTTNGVNRYHYFPTKTAARQFVKEECAGDQPEIIGMKVGLTGQGVAGALNFHVESTCQNEG